MLKTITLRFGAGEGAEPLVFSPGPMTVFVGPNNSGKSLALRELEAFIETGGEGIGFIVADLDPDLPAPDVVAEMVLSRQTDDSEAPPPPPGYTRVVRLKSPGELSRRRVTDPAEPLAEQLINLDAVIKAMHDVHRLSDEEFALLCRDVLTLFTIRLDGQTRLALTHPRAAGSPGDHPAHHLAALYRDDAARERIREITADAFGLYFVIDRTDDALYRIRMAERAPMDDAEEQGSDERTLAFHGLAHDIADLSDGVRAFTGLTSAVLSADYRIMLVDEPEAFLHPPLTRKLGKRLTQLASDRGANVLASTHSPEFLMGCVQSGKRVNVVRLTWRRGIATARLLSADKLDAMMRDPLLRSTGVLGALFHEGAIICEADADRVFYAEINERLLAARAGGADGCVFLNAQNKQTIRRILRPLREMGIPAVAVVDLDILKGREDFRDLLKSAFVPPVFWEPWEERRQRLDQKLKGERYKEGGIYTLARDVRALAEELLDLLGQYGLFLVPPGELECWLPELEVGGHGPEWLTAVFQKMGIDPTHEGYQRPGGGGVWRFMQRVAAWIADPRRRGMEEEVIPIDHLLPAPDDEPRRNGKRAAADDASPDAEMALQEEPPSPAAA